MKKIILSLSLIVSVFFIQAQNLNISINGLIQNTDGIPVAGVDVNIAIDSAAIVEFQYYDSTTSAEDGSYGFDIEVPEQLTEGFVFVSITDCHGNWQHELLRWHPDNMDLTANFVYCPPTCDITIDVNNQSTAPLTVLTVEASGTAPFTYNWNTGESTSSIMVTETGRYCVSVTDVNSCSRAACIDVNLDTIGGIDTSCWVFIEEIQNGDLLQAVATGNEPFEYNWSTGETSSTIEVQEAGNYCVTITDGIGCMASNCYFIESNVPNYQIRGFAYPIDSNTFISNLQGRVYLIQHDALAGTLTAVDSIDFGQTGSFAFGELVAGDYLLKAALLPESDEYENHLPTYYGQSLWWDEATTITIPYIGNQYFGIFLLEGDNLGGPGFIGGSISDGANFGPLAEEARGNGTSLAGISVLLLDESDNPVSHTVSDENGEFEFPSLAYGTYKVYLEILGVEQAFALVTLSPDRPSVRDLAFEVNENGISSATVSLFNEQQLQLFPNPTKESFELFINSPSAMDATITVATLMGKTILSQKQNLQLGQQSLHFDINHLASGVYLVHIQATSGIVTRKMIKN